TRDLGVRRRVDQRQAAAAVGVPVAARHPDIEVLRQFPTEAAVHLVIAVAALAHHLATSCATIGIPAKPGTYSADARPSWKMDPGLHRGPIPRHKIAQAARRLPRRRRPVLSSSNRSARRSSITPPSCSA